MAAGIAGIQGRLGRWYQWDPAKPGGLRVSPMSTATANKRPGRLGILVGGGPAPGINSAISSAAIEAVNSGLEVIGIFDGFEHLAAGRTDMVQPLYISDVSRIHAQGGSILRTSRTNPTRLPEDLQRTLQALLDLNVAYLVTIGGDDTAFAASELARVADGRHPGGPCA